MLGFVDRRKLSSRPESGMTTQTIVLISIFVTVAIAAGVAVIALTRTSGDQAQQRITSEHISYQPDCPLPTGKTEGVIVSLEGFATLAADVPVGGGLTLTSADTISAYLTSALVESDHGVDLNFDGKLSDHPVSQIYLTSKADETYGLLGKTLTSESQAILPLDNPGNLATLQTKLAQGTKLHINKTKHRCWNATQTSSNNSNTGIQQQIDNTPLDPNRIITYSSSCPRAGDPANEYARAVTHGGSNVGWDITNAHTPTPNSVHWFRIGTGLNESTHNVDLDHDSVAADTNKIYLTVAPRESSTHAVIQAGFANGELNPLVVGQMALLAHPGSEMHSQIESKYLSAVLYINKEPASRCWAVETN